MGPYFRWAVLFITGVLFLMVLLHRNSSEVHLAIRTEDETVAPIETPRGPKKYWELEEAVFRPLGYKIREKTIIPALDYITEPNCPEVFTEWLKRSEKQDEAGTPPRDIPADLVSKYTLDNYTHLILAYMDDRSGTHSATWTIDQINGYVNADIAMIRNYDGEGRGVYEAMKAYATGVTGKRGIVIGSLSPWVESFPLKLNASHVRTIEYMKINVDHPKVDYRHPVDIAKDHKQHIGAYDWAASFSSLEHSGLGRFGDALDPVGDLKESLKTFCMLKKGGYFFLGFPMGYDTIHWNLHRIYGRIRLALMAAGFDLLDMFYKDAKIPIQAGDFAKTAKEGAHKQFVVVLRKR